MSHQTGRCTDGRSKRSRVPKAWRSSRGDALLVYSGKDPFVRAGGGYAGGDRPGLSVTCAKFIRDHDVSLLGWDMMDARPDPFGLTFPVHGVLFNYGVALLDNALLEPLAEVCAEEGRYRVHVHGAPAQGRTRHGEPGEPGCDVLVLRRGCAPDPTRPLAGPPRPTPRPRGAHVRALAGC